MKFWQILNKGKKIGTDKKVFVGMSGGVDSSVSAALLQRQGYDVTGVFIKVWHPDFLPCTWEDERRDAMRVAAKLGIPFLTFDFEKEYKQEVVDYMVREYKAGRTPNPDVMCNKYVKFGAFFKKAREMGADYIATGHYAMRDGSDPFNMLESEDTNKDQTYFLWTLKQEELKHTLFPIGHLKKPKVRKLAEKFGLANAQKHDSQGLCFLGKVDMRTFLKHFIEQKEGDVVDEKGTVIGKHEGALYYTIGQRHGFTINTKGTATGPHYIISKDVEKNILVVSEKPEKSKENPTEIKLESVNWISGNTPPDGKYEVRFRYRQKLRNALVKSDGEDATVTFEGPQQRVSAGQSLVVYSKGICMGGGIIS